MSGTPDLFGPQPPRPSHGERLFYAFLLDRTDARRVRQFGQDFIDENHIVASLLHKDRRHISLEQVGDFKHLASWRIHAAKMAGDQVFMSPFDVMLDFIMSFNAVPKLGRPPSYPMVLRCDGAGLFELHHKLGTAMRHYGMRSVPEFTPHLTLSYNEWPISGRSIAPIHLRVTDFCLIHSRLWLKEYRILKRWTLNEPLTRLH